MAKETRENGDSAIESTSKGGDLREKYLEDNRRGVTHGEGEIETSRQRQSRERLSTDEETRKQTHANYQGHHIGYSKLDFSKFLGDDVKYWLFRVEQFFNYDEITMDQRVGLAGMHLEGEAIVRTKLHASARGRTSSKVVFISSQVSIPQGLNY
ncbi:hypothetical protein HAX54_017786, partial [Datura stramonium]|nr:hypothetical protein [Datura stramonium]